MKICVDSLQKKIKKNPHKPQSNLEKRVLDKTMMKYLPDIKTSTFDKDLVVCDDALLDWVTICLISK